MINKIKELVKKCWDTVEKYCAKKCLKAIKDYEEHDKVGVSFSGNSIYIKDKYLKKGIEEDAEKIKVNRIGCRYFVDPQEALERSMKRLGSGTKSSRSAAKKLSRKYKRAQKW